MTKGTGFSSYWFDKKFYDLPPMTYFAQSRALDLVGTCINIVPSNMKGVDEVWLGQKPVAVAPDFNGKVFYNHKWGYMYELTSKELRKAKAVYQKFRGFCEEPHTWIGNSSRSGYYNLPKNMCFVTIGDRTFLNLRDSDVELNRSNLWISGVKAVLLPTDRVKKAARLLKRMALADRQRQQ